MATYLPEGYQTQYDMPVSFRNIADAHEALSSRRILEARAVVCDACTQFDCRSWLHERDYSA